MNSLEVLLVDLVAMGESPEGAAPSPRGRAWLLVALLSGPAFLGCSQNRGSQEGDAPRTVTFQGKLFYASCTAVHQDRLGEPVDAIYDYAVRFPGANVQFESRAIIGFDRSEAIALWFAMPSLCRDEGPAYWTAATSQDVTFRPRQIEILEEVGTPPS